MSLCTPHERSTVSGARMTSTAAGNPGLRRHPADVQAPDWEWSQIRRRRLVVSGWLGRGAAGTRRPAPRRMAQRGTAHDDQVGAASHRLPRRSSPGQRSTSSISWCPTGGPCFASGFAAARGETRASDRSIWPRSACRRSRRSRSANSGSASSCSRITWSRWRFRRRFRSTSSSSTSFPESPSRSGRRSARRLAQAMAVMTARLHDAGLLHHDFHPGNILVRLAADHAPELFMIDLDALRKSRRRDLEAGPAEPGAPRSLLLAAQQPDRPLSLLESVSAKPRTEPPPRSAGLPTGSRTRRASGPSGSGGGGAGAAGRRTSTSKSIPAVTRWCVASRDLDPGGNSAAAGRSRPPFQQPATRLLKNSRTTTVAETTMLVRARPPR